MRPNELWTCQDDRVVRVQVPGSNAVLVVVGPFEEEEEGIRIASKGARQAEGL